VLLLVDLDGVVYRGRTAIPGVAAVLAARARAGDDVVYVTNNSMHYRADYVARLEAMGAPVAADRVVSSARATALYLSRERPDVHRVVVLGGAGLRRELEDVGLEVVDAGSASERLAALLAEARAAGTRPPSAADLAGRPGAVVVGLDPGLTYRSLAFAADAIRAGADFIATNRDPVFPTEHGLRPGAGAVVAAVETATGVAPLTIGKPAKLLLVEAARAVGGRPRDSIVIGDGLLTDMAAARAVGARAILMLTGVTTREQVDALPDDERPDAVAADAAALGAALDRLAASGTGPLVGPPAAGR
jgi:phosphoglycolate/pyridoxal phosphate phosphatase family enzyme